MIRKHQRFFNIMQVSLDAISLLLAYFGSVVAKQTSGNFTGNENMYIWSTLWMLPLLLIVYYFMDVYSPMRSRLYRKEVLIITRAHLGGVVIIFSVLFLNKHLEYSREVSLLFAFMGLFLILLERYVIRRTLRQLRRSGYNQKHMLIIGAGPVGT
jgi:FlaA1/EpsC-like NDP-sugar epimerase